MANFTVDPDIVEQKAKAVDEYAETYDAISRELLSVATTMGAAYDSADNKTFVSRIEDCSKDLKAMAEKLRFTSNTMKEQANEYRKREMENTQRAANLP